MVSAIFTLLRPWYRQSSSYYSLALRDLREAQSAKEAYDEFIEDLVLFDAADVAAFFDQEQRRRADLLVRSLNAVDEHIVLLAGDQENGDVIVPDRPDITFELVLRLE